MRTTVIALMFLALATVACSDRVPAPATPTLSPRPGYPPAPASELPEGVLFVNNQNVPVGALFRLEGGREAVEIGAVALGPVSPDSSRAVAQTYEGKSVIEIGLMTGARIETIAQGRWLMGAPWFVWSNDGRRLAYVLPAQTDSATASIWALDTESGEKMLLTEEADSFWMLGWTAAGDVLVSASVGLALLGSTQRAVTLPEPGTVIDSAISPDGRSVAVKLGEYEYSEADQVTYIHSSGIWVGEFAGDDWRLVLDLADEPLEVQTIAPTGMQWSPDGTRISTHLSQFDEHQVIGDILVVLDVRTGAKREVHRRGWGQESWSPDGRYLAYMQGASGYSADSLRILGPDGRTRRMANVRRVAWAKDGRLLVDIPGHFSLLDPDTMERKEVVTEDGESISALLEAPVWSPSGRYFALSTPADMYHRSSLYVIDTEDGTAEVFLDEAGFAPVAWLR